MATRDSTYPRKTVVRIEVEVSEGKTRIERDLLGPREIPTEVYWGIHTLRACENFPISGVSIGQTPFIVAALASVKEACAIANGEVGSLDPLRVEAIGGACREIRDGALRDQFVVDAVQGGAGTSSNMNANEVIANRGLELLGHGRGEYSFLDPNEDVNRSQSTNDVYATAVRIALIRSGQTLGAAMEHLRLAFAAKAIEFEHVVKLGRTQLQDAVPMSLGQEFGSYATMVREDCERLEEAIGLLHEVNIGGTAIGTGLAAPPGYGEAARARLAEITNLPLRRAEDLVEATADAGVFVQFSGAVKRVAVKLSKICNDLRLLSSGPDTGLGDISLPPRQAGSSLMPGKVNPVIPEVVNAIAFDAIGRDLTVTMAAEAGQLQLNPFVPLILHALSDSCRRLTAGCETLADHCVGEIEPNRQRLQDNVGGPTALLTGLAPYIGYHASTEIVRVSESSGRDIRELVAESGLVTGPELEHIIGDLSFCPLPEKSDL